MSDPTCENPSHRTRAQPTGGGVATTSTPLPGAESVLGPRESPALGPRWLVWLVCGLPVGSKGARASERRTAAAPPVALGLALSCGFQGREKAGGLLAPPDFLVFCLELLGPRGLMHSLLLQGGRGPAAGTRHPCPYSDALSPLPTRDRVAGARRRPSGQLFRNTRSSTLPAPPNPPWACLSGTVGGTRGDVPWAPHSWGPRASLAEEREAGHIAFIRGRGAGASACLP